MVFLSSFLLSFMIGFTSAFVISKVGFKCGLKDIPNHRSAHNIPIPKGGGIGIPIAFGLITFLYSQTNYCLAVTALFISIVALINDRDTIKVKIRLILEFIPSIVFLWVCKKWLIIFAYEHYSVIASILLVCILAIFIVASANFFNFMDGINGIAGLAAIISFAFLGFFALYIKKSPEIAYMAFSVASASAGFLFLNFPKAKVFMGDVGSIFVGFCFAGIVIYLVADIKEFFLLVLFLSLFYIDASITILIRLYNKKNISQAHNAHLYQRLVHIFGWTHTKVAISYCVVQTLICITGFILFKYNIILLVLFWISILLLYCGVLISLVYKRRHQSKYKDSPQISNIFS